MQKNTDSYNQHPQQNQDYTSWPDQQSAMNAGGYSNQPYYQDPYQNSQQSYPNASFQGYYDPSAGMQSQTPIGYDANGYPVYQQNPQGWQQSYQQPYQQPFQQTYQQPVMTSSPVPVFTQPPAAPTPQQPESNPGKGKKNKKPKKAITVSLWKIVLPAVLMLLVAIWFLAGKLLGSTQTSAVVEQGSIGETYHGDALIIRNETAYDEEGVQDVEFVASEGTVVSRGDVLCYVYSTGYSTREMTSLQDFRNQIKNYEQTLLKGETAYDQKMSRLENEVIDSGLEVRSLVQGARGNMINQEKLLAESITERQNYFRSKYSTDMRLNRLFDDENTQQQRIDSWIKQKVATQDSIVSFYTDGFEYALTPAQYESYSPQQVRSMVNGVIPETSAAARGRTNLYRLVKQGNYAVLMLIRNTNWNPIEGNTYKLVLEQFTDTVVSARVLSFTRSGGELLLRLAVMGDVNEVLYMRTCEARLGEYVDCLSVPEKALYTKNDTTGVVLIGADAQVFVPVKVLKREAGKVFITPVQTGTLTTGQSVRLF